MQKNIEIDNELYEKLRKESIFFLKFNERYYYDMQGYIHDNSVWQAINKDLGISFSANKFGNHNLGYCLCIIDKAEQAFNNEGKPISGRVNMYFHEASATNNRDYLILIKNCIERSKDKEDKYAFVELLWFFDKKGVNFNSLKNAIEHCGDVTIPFVLDVIKRFCRCLSLNKQKIIKAIFDVFGSQYDIYMPTLIVEAVKCCKLSCDTENLNIFQLVDIVLNVGWEKLSQEADANDNNLLLQMRTWLHTEKSLVEYNTLKPLFSIVAEPIRLDIVKRYFHDIRLGHTSLDLNLLSQFKDNQFDEFIRYRYATETPLERINLTVPLLCDNILTLYKTKGKTFQSFEGVLDFAITHCDKVHPGVDFKLERIIPVCKNGAVYNSYSFKGFIDYQVIRKINETKLTDSSLLNCIRNVLDKYGNRLHYPVCKFGDNSKIEDAEFEKCSQKFKPDGKKLKLECYTYKYYDDKWTVKLNKTNIIVLNSFLANSIDESKNIGDILIDINLISLDVFRNFIMSLPSLYEDIGNNEFLVHSYKSKDKTYQLSLIEQFSDILRVRIFPQKGALVGEKFDVFGFWKEMRCKLTPEQLKDSRTPEHKSAKNAYLTKEIEEVRKRTIDSLKKDFNITDYDVSYVETPYNRETLVRVLSKYYFKESFKDDDDISKREFLTTNDVKGNFRPFCAPKLSEVNNPAIDLPYFWCRGKECFHNNLENQTLKETYNWREYSLYHLIEIIGYPKLHETIAGNEPEPVVWNFIAVTNKVMQKFRRLKCRTCGHLLFADKGIGFNRYNYYSCKNPTCAEVSKSVYLSYCYKCKKGLIDSRDTKQCPNGWYICPTCLACCDDAQYERLAQRYIISNRPVPKRIEQMLGKGHNDKDEYFCPDCGARIEIREDEHGGCYKSCSSCNKVISNYQNEDFWENYS